MKELIRLKLANSAKQVSFITSTHEYRYGTKLLKSVTTLIKEYTPEFDSISMAERCSKKEGKYYGIEPKDIARQWEEDMNTKADFGTTVHQIAEMIFSSIPSSMIKSFDTQQFVDSIAELYNIFRDKVISTEQVIFDYKLGLAGQIDFLAYNNGMIDLYDWKTSEEIDNKAYGKLKGNFIHIPNSKFDKYSLQLSIYKHILIRKGYKVNKMYLIQLTKEGHKEIECKDYSNILNL